MGATPCAMLTTSSRTSLMVRAHGEDQPRRAHLQVIHTTTLKWCERLEHCGAMRYTMTRAHKLQQRFKIANVTNGSQTAVVRF